MNKIFLGLLSISMVLLTGCEHISENSSNTIPSSEQPRATNFSVAKSENNQVERVPSLAVQDFKKLAASWGSDTDVLSDNFFNSTEDTTSTPDVKLGEATDFDNFFSNANQDQSSDTKFNTTAKPPMATETLVQSIPRVLSYYEKQEKIKFINLLYIRNILNMKRFFFFSNTIIPIRFSCKNMFYYAIFYIAFSAQYFFFNTC